MAVNNCRFLKVNRISRKKILVLSVLFISFLLIPFLNNLNINRNFSENEQNYNKDEDIAVQNLKTQDLTTDNLFSGIGAPWKVSHWANRTDYNLPVSFGNGSSDTVNMNLGSGWEGYQLNSTIKDLYDTRNWINGTFHEGPDDGYTNPANDSRNVLNWTWGKYDNPDNGNPMSGNYFDGTSDPISNEDYIELQINKSFIGEHIWNIGDRCWWNSSFKIPRGKVIEGAIFLTVYPYTVDIYSNSFIFEIYLNDKFIYGNGLYSLNSSAGGNWFNLQISLDNFLDDPDIFPDPVNNANMNITIQLKTLSDIPSQMANLMGDTQRIFFDNVSLVLQTEVKPKQIGLRMNNQPVSDIDWGNGTVGQIYSWNETPVEVKFNSTEVRPFEMGGYDIEFTSDVNLYAKRMSTDSQYQPNFPGTNFEVKNDSSVEWECYARVSVPTGYRETNMTIRFPQDVNITWISNAEYPNTNILKLCDNSTLGILKVSNFSETPDGFWWVKGISPNYCNDLKIYNNVTSSWILNNTFLSGDYINITGNIGSSIGLDISSYIENTRARLYIRFPNGTIWTAQNQIKSVNDTGWVYFDPIIIPNGVPNYEEGEYEAIITWNNSYSSFELNETGIIYKKFNVIHDSILEPDQGIYFIENVIDDRIVNLKVSYKDIVDDTAIEEALVYTNFAGEDHNFTETSPGFYLFEFNASKANAGNNTLTIFANSTYYLNKVLNITVDVVKETLLKVETDFFTVPWKQNFTVRFNYTEKNNPLIGINVTDDISIDWLDYHLTQPFEGQYELECNTSAYDSLTLQSFIISINPYKYEAQSVLIRVQITEIETSLKLSVNNIQMDYSDSIQVELGQNINITAQYRDNITKNHLPGATVNLLGIDTLNETGDQYTKIIDADVLDQGITALTVFAQLVNYKPQSINFFIEVIEKATDLRLILNSEEKSLDPVFNLTIGEILNITIKYTEQAGAYVPNAVVELIGEGISTNLTRDDVLEQHYIELDTMDLKIGVNIFSVVARSTNYQIQTIKPIITIHRISTLINISSQISAEPGEDATLKVTLIDTYFGGTIQNTIVTYKWAYGQGELIDLHNNGIYEGILENVPEGTYTITITAFGSDNYDFETKEITLIVTRPESEPGPDLSWLVYVLIGAMIGLVVLFTLYQTHFKYPPMVRKIRKLKKKVRKAKRIKPILVNKRDQLIKNQLQNQIKIIEYESIQAIDVDKIEKILIKEEGED